MAIALMLLIFGVCMNIALLSRSTKGFPRFANTCEGCGCQTPPMEYPPAVYECPVCQWMMTHQSLREQLKSRRD